MESAASSSSPFQRTTDMQNVPLTIENLPRHRVFRTNPNTLTEQDIKPRGKECQ